MFSLLKLNSTQLNSTQLNYMAALVKKSSDPHQIRWGTLVIASRIPEDRNAR